MAITKNSARQEVIAARVTGAFGTGKDVPVQGAYAAIELPQNAVVIGGNFVVDGATSASVTAAIGDSGSSSRYAGSINCNATGLTALTPTGYKYTTQSNILVTIGGADPATVGSFELVVLYVVEGRAEFSQGVLN